MQSAFAFLSVLFLSALQCHAATKFEVKTCLVDAVGLSCVPQPVDNLRYQRQPVQSTSCDATVGQKGSLSFVDLTLPSAQVLFVQVTTAVPGQSTAGGFFIRPTRISQQWGNATLGATGTTASFYLADTGQFSVEFAASTMWTNIEQANNFEALMLFVNPEWTVDKAATLIQPGSDLRVLGPNKAFRFGAGLTYDWKEDTVFHVLDNTAVYFEPGSYVRARIIQTKQKVNNVTISGYGVLDSHYDPVDHDIPGLSDDAARQTIHILGKNVNVFGVTMVNTNPNCHGWGYCLNINANWAPLADANDYFEATELQTDPPYKFRQAHCQERNMDDSPNNDFTNCPTSREEGPKVAFVKCITWQMGQDGLNAGKFGTVQNSFVRVVDDALKPWDSDALYQNITIWQLPLGWPINLGWWGWQQSDKNTVLDGIYLIHNQNWMTSKDWPSTQSGQCVVGGIYGSSSVKSGYRISNIFVETACSCAVGLQISNKAFNRHLTADGCVGSIKDMQITNMHFDEEFYKTGGYTNYLSGEKSPKAGCVGDLSGKIEKLVISGSVAGRPLTRADFIVDDDTVSGLVFRAPTAPTTAPRGPMTPRPTRQPTMQPTTRPTSADPSIIPFCQPGSARGSGVQVKLASGSNEGLVLLDALPCALQGIAGLENMQLEACPSCDFPVVLKAAGLRITLNPWPTQLGPEGPSLQWVPRHSCVDACTELGWTDGVVKNKTARCFTDAQYAGAACYCDDACTQYKDCCYDYSWTCGASKGILAKDYGTLEIKA